MRVAFWFLIGLAACDAKKSPCDSIKVRVDETTVMELPARAEYCLYTPDMAGCCRSEHTDCDALARSPSVFLGIEHPPGCTAGY